MTRAPRSSPITSSPPCVSSAAAAGPDASRGARARPARALSGARADFIITDELVAAREDLCAFDARGMNIVEGRLRG